MGRKTAKDLKPRQTELLPVKISKSTAKEIDGLRSCKSKYHEKAHEAFDRYIAAEVAKEEEYARNDKLATKVDGVRNVSVDILQQWEDSCRRLDARIRAVFGAWDAMVYAHKHAEDAIRVPIEDVTAIVTDTLASGLDGMGFQLNHGLLAYHIARVVQSVSREDDGTLGVPPLCEGCSG